MTHLVKQLAEVKVRFPCYAYGAGLLEAESGICALYLLLPGSWPKPLQYLLVGPNQVHCREREWLQVNHSLNNLNELPLYTSPYPYY